MSRDVDVIAAWLNERFGGDHGDLSDAADLVGHLIDSGWEITPDLPPDPELAAELARLEADDPDVREAARRVDEALEWAAGQTPNQARAHNVLTAWLSARDGTGVRDVHRTEAAGILDALADSGLQVVSEGDDSGPAP